MIAFAAAEARSVYGFSGSRRVANVQIALLNHAAPHSQSPKKPYE